MISTRPTDQLEAETAVRARTGVADPPLIGAGRRLGERYRLERRLGHGGMAVVWLATDERLEREVAIKVISDTLAGDATTSARFRREAHVAAGLQHPNLVAVYDFDAGARPYLVMEYIPGGDLAERLSAGEVPEVGTARRRAAVGASPHPRRRRPAPRHQAAQRAHRRAPGALA